jgi:K+-sensing histidine kinase KdpD
MLLLSTSMSGSMSAPEPPAPSKCRSRAASQPVAVDGPARLAYASSTLAIAATTVLATFVRYVLHLPDPEMLFLLAIMITAVWLGRGPSLLAAALSVGAYDFFFVTPYHTFGVANSRYLLTFAMMFAEGVLISELATRLRRQERTAAANLVRARSEELRSTLLSTVSHDLRTPLATITGAATTLRDDDDLPAEIRHELLDSVCEEAERLERLVGNLLEMTRLESGSLELHREWVPVEELVGAALSRMEAKLGSRPIEVSLPAELPLVPVDPVLMQQLFINLIDNAIKYTAPASPIRIVARHAPPAVLIELSDRGPGLPDDVRLFERFRRGSHRGVPGAGLGLAICRGIIEAHGGSIRASNAVAGGGASFEITLPIVGTPPSLPPEEEREGG